MKRGAAMKLAAAALVAGSLAAHAQQAAPPTFVTRVDAVRVDVLASDGGRPIAGLTAADFELRDNGAPQRIQSVELEDTPLDVLLVLDASGSVAGAPLDRLRQAARTLLGELRGQDRAALITFSDRLRAPVWPPASPPQVAKALDAFGASGGTALLDAVYTALLLRQGSPNRVMVLVFSDGYDTSSWMPSATIMEVAKQTDLVIYAVASQERDAPPPLPIRREAQGVAGSMVLVPVQPSSSDRVPKILEELTAATGGVLLRAGAQGEIKKQFVRALRDVKSRYVLSYMPQNVAREGWHAIDVTLTRRKGKVTARRGYLVGAGG